MATKARPIRLRTRFMVPTRARTTKTRRKKYMSRWEAILYPKNSGRGTSIDACTPPLMKVTWLMVHSMMSCPARVAIARYRPLIRRDGMPTMAPTMAAMRPPSTRLTGHGHPNRTTRLAAV
jgi:hypothetical protein